MISNTDLIVIALVTIIFVAIAYNSSKKKK